MNNFTSCTYTEDDFKALLICDYFLHNLASLVILLHPEDEYVEDATHRLLVLFHGLWIVSVVLTSQAHHAQVVVRRLQAQTLRTVRLVLTVSSGRGVVAAGGFQMKQLQEKARYLVIKECSPRAETGDYKLVE